MNSRKLDDLDPDARSVCQQHLALCHAIGIELIVTSTWRDGESQDALYAIGRTVEIERRPVTNARAFKSWHQFKCAWDVAPVVNGKVVWDAKDPIWKEIIKCGKEAGALAGADWPLFPDMPHFYVAPKVEGLHITLAEAQTRWDANHTIFV